MLNKMPARFATKYSATLSRSVSDTQLCKTSILVEKYVFVPGRVVTPAPLQPAWIVVSPVLESNEFRGKYFTFSSVAEQGKQMGKSDSALKDE